MNAQVAQMHLVYKPLNTTRSLLLALYRPLRPFAAAVWAMHFTVAIATVAALLLFRFFWNQQSIAQWRRWLSACGNAVWEYAIAMLGQAPMRQRLYGIFFSVLHVHVVICADRTRHALFAIVGLLTIFLPLLYEDLLLTALLLLHGMHKAPLLVDWLFVYAALLLVPLHSMPTLPHRIETVNEMTDEIARGRYKLLLTETSPFLASVRVLNTLRFPKD